MFVSCYYTLLLHKMTNLNFTFVTSKNKTNYSLKNMKSFKIWQSSLTEAKVFFLLTIYIAAMYIYNKCVWLVMKKIKYNF